MTNRDIAEMFDEMADLLEIRGENPFRIRAYRKAARNIEGIPREAGGMTEEDLLDIPGIGKDLASKIKEYASTGRLRALEDLKKQMPEGIAALLAVPGLGPKTASLLYDRLKVKDIDGLERLAIEHKLSGMPGIKDKTEENILKGIGILKRGRERRPIGSMLPAANEITELLRKESPVRRISLAGSLRRWKETIKDIDILATSDEPEKVMNAFVHLSVAKQILMHGPTKSSIVIADGVQVDLRVVEEDSFGSALCYFTGSKAHNIRLREMASKAGLKINEYGIFREKDDKRLGGEREEDIYNVLGLPCIPPELREDAGEIEAAVEGRLPELVDPDDIRGDLHVHTKYSDGSHGIEELVDEARKRGYEYIAITDHTKGLGIARGLNEEKILEQVREIRAINQRLKGFRLLTGTEVDIRSDYTLDLPDGILGKLDIVVASIHSGFRQQKEQLTGRMIAAIKNPFVNIIAHPTGRLIGERDAYDVDIEKIFRAAAEHGKAIEINAYPLRLDINDVYARRAKAMGIKMAVNTDTHVANQFDYMTFGVSIARRGWLEKNDVLNTHNAKNLIKCMGKLRAV